MTLRRQKARVSALSSLATEQKRLLTGLRAGMRRWKRETFGRPETLALAFVAGLALAPSSDQPEEESGGKKFPMKLLEASFLAWRLLGNRVTTGEDPANTDVNGAFDA